MRCIMPENYASFDPIHSHSREVNVNYVPQKKKKKKKQYVTLVRKKIALDLQVDSEKSTLLYSAYFSRLILSPSPQERHLSRTTPAPFATPLGSHEQICLTQMAIYMLADSSLAFDIQQRLS